MKKNSFFLHLALLLSPVVMWAQSLSISPEKPVPGEDVILYYNPKGGPLENAKQISASVYYLNDAFPKDKSVQIPIPRPIPIHLQLEENQGVFSGKVLTGSSTKLLKVLFYTSDKKLDHDGGQGYSVLMYNAALTEPAQGANAQEAISRLTHAYYMGLKVSEEVAFRALEEEFRLYPSSMDNFVYYMTYAGLAMEFNHLKALSQVKGRLQYLLGEETDAGETELSLAFSLAKMLEMPEETDLAYQKIQNKYPKSFVVEFETEDRFYESADLDEKEVLFQFLLREFNETAPQQATIQDAAMVMANAYLPVDLEKFSYYARLSKNREQLAGQANAMAWQLAGEGVARPAIDLERAEKLVTIAIEVIEGQIADLQADKQEGQIKYLRLPESQAAFIDTYALIWFKRGDLKKALELQERSMQYDPNPNLEVVDRYALYFDKNNDDEATKNMLAEKIRNNQATERMKNRFLELADRRELKALEKSSNDRYYEDVRKQMFQQPAPEFSLKNLEGTPVSLSQLKGKVVIIDFWATWCAPCLSSFTGMQQVVENYRGDEEVVFLFVDCWESENTTAATISEFLATEGYLFDVLMDVKNKVVKDYGVEGIPAKFVIDKKGNIRFSNAGFGGTDKLVKELTAVIEILKTASE